MPLVDIREGGIDDPPARLGVGVNRRTQPDQERTAPGRPARNSRPRKGTPAIFRQRSILRNVVHSPHG
jgi:hypothetical protein